MEGPSSLGCKLLGFLSGSWPLSDIHIDTNSWGPNNVLWLEPVMKLLVVLGFNATFTAKVIIIMVVGNTHVSPGFLTPVLTQFTFESHQLLFSHASAEVKGESTPESNFTSTGSQTHKHKVMSPTRSPLSHPGRACNEGFVLISNWKNSAICEGSKIMKCIFYAS